MRPLRIAIAGLGYWGPNYVRLLTGELPDAQLVACCDLDAGRLDSVRARHPQVRTYCEIDGLLAADDVDAVVIATPASTHGSLAEAALRAGKHVLVEKPLAEAAYVAKAMIAAAEGADRVLMVAHTFLFNPAVRYIKSAIDDGRLGRLLYVFSQRTGLGPVRSDVNVLWDLAPHDFSMLEHWLQTTPASTQAQGASYLSEAIEDVVIVSMTFPGNVLAGVHVSWLDPVKVRRTTVVGTRQMIVFDDTDPTEKLRVYANTAAYAESPGDYAAFVGSVRAGDITIPRLPAEEPLHAQLRHFVTCVREGRQPLTDGAAGLRVVEMLEAAQTSLQASSANGSRPLSAAVAPTLTGAR